MDIDLIVLIVIAVIFAFVTFRFGKTYLVSFILSFYPAYFLFDLLQDNYFDSTSSSAIIGLFVVSLALMTYIHKKTVVAGFSFSPTKRWIDAVILSLGAISQCALIYYYVLPQLAGLYTLSGFVSTFFQSTVSYGVLALVPFVALLISARD